ncbi:MAG: hypothetical protein KME10_10340 [Plectolyngbya sp. WJT66-NPBG17]|jgi:hypothetical protein|nr:hypothetical protein [Plectolyngbya sp. WJT66-NPBG17]MBW4524871.1 hypothetical protein [Phormidium tanganyikae FI6-MK23]
MCAAESEIVELVQAFEDCSLARLQWTHSAHLTVALWYLINYPSTATDQICYGIQRYNQVHGVESTPTSGYHETIMQFWIALIQNYLSCIDIHDLLLSLTHRFIDDHSDPALLFEYYSPDRIFSPEARSRWMEPNLKSLNYARI